MRFASSLGMALVALSVSVDGFVLPHAPQKQTTTLNLVPEQGMQLVAAFEASSVHQDDETHPRATEETSIGVMGSAKAFVSRIFSIPGAILGRHPAAAPVDLHLTSSFGDDSSEDDVVLYPIVGFQFVKDKNSEGSHVLPTTSHAACRISHLPDQQVYGWYTTACPLDSIYSDTYCEAPEKSEDS